MSRLDKFTKPAPPAEVDPTDVWQKQVLASLHSINTSSQETAALLKWFKDTLTRWVMVSLVLSVVGVFCAVLYWFSL